MPPSLASSSSSRPLLSVARPLPPPDPDELLGCFGPPNFDMVLPSRLPVGFGSLPSPPPFPFTAAVTAATTVVPVADCVTVGRIACTTEDFFCVDVLAVAAGVGAGAGGGACRLLFAADSLARICWNTALCFAMCGTPKPCP